jgi:hypothetical protein
MYAADRVKPPIPLKINEPEDSALEEARAKQAEILSKQAKSSAGESGEVVAQEFN